MPTRPAKITKTAAPNTGREGAVYLTSTGSPYKPPSVTAYKLKEYSKNFYGAGIAKKLIALFFGDRYEIEVTNDKGEKDEELSKEVYNMASAREVSLFSKMKTGWTDRFWLGMGFFNPVWEEAGPGWILKELRRLPPESFAPAAQDLGIATVGQEAAVSGNILRGVVAMPESAGGAIRYFQTGASAVQHELKQIYVIKDSTAPDVAGEPEILPVVPVITMLDFAWKAQMQKNNRIAAPILILRIVNAKGDDVKYGEKLIKNWGKDTAFLLRSNMEIVDFNPADSDTALTTIEKLTEMIIDYWVPTNLLSKNGQLIGGNSNSDLSLLYSFIAGVHREIEAEWEPLLQIYLDANGYENYRVKIKIPDPEIDDSAIQLEQAKVGAETGLLTDNEVRTRLGAEEMTPEELEELPARKKEAQAQESARLQAEALKARSQAGPEEGQEEAGNPGQPGPGRVEAQRGPRKGEQGEPDTQTSAQTKKAPKTSKKAAQQFKQSRHDEHDGEQDPDPTLSKIIDDEEQELNLALDALARAVLAKL